MHELGSVLPEVVAAAVLTSWAFLLILSLALRFYVAVSPRSMVYCRVLRFEFETSRQLKIRALLVVFCLLVAIAGFVVLLMVRSILVGYPKMMPMQKRLLTDHICLTCKHLRCLCVLGSIENLSSCWDAQIGVACCEVASSWVMCLAANLFLPDQQGPGDHQLHSCWRAAGDNGRGDCCVHMERIQVPQEGHALVSHPRCAACGPAGPQSIYYTQSLLLPPSLCLFSPDPCSCSGCDMQCCCRSLRRRTMSRIYWIMGVTMVRGILKHTDDILGIHC